MNNFTEETILINEFTEEEKNAICHVSALVNNFNYSDSINQMIDSICWERLFKLCNDTKIGDHNKGMISIIFNYIKDDGIDYKKIEEKRKEN